MNNIREKYLSYSRKHVINAIITYLEIQLFITNMSLPILIWWGLPLSLASPFANAAFSPVLMFWLICSSLIFLTELFHIPNTYILYGLEYFTHFYQWLLSWAPSWLLIPIYKPPFVFLILFSLITLFILHAKILTYPWSRIISYIISCWIFIFFCFFIKFFRADTIHIIQCPPGQVYLITTRHSNWLVDPGYLNKNWSDSSWIDFQLIPQITKLAGKNNLDGLITLKTTKKTLENLSRLIISSLSIRKVYCCFDSSDTKFALCHRIATLRRICKKTHTKLYILSYPSVLRIYKENSTELVLNSIKSSSHHASIKWFLHGVIHYESFEIHNRSNQHNLTQSLSKTKMNNNLASPQHYEKEPQMPPVDFSETKVLFIIASDGFQPIEYGVPKAILEKAGIRVFTASDQAGGAIASDKSTVPVDIVLDKVKATDYDGIFFIGGPGAMEHLDNPTSYRIACEAQKHKIPYGAICISTRILAKAHALVGKKATGWNDDNALETILVGNGAIYDKKDIVTDGFVVTATGPKTVELFADGILRVLTKKVLKNN